TDPATGYYSTSIPVEYSIPEAMLSNSLHITFTGPMTLDATLVDVAPGSHSFTISTSSTGVLVAPPEVASFNLPSLDEGTYTVSVSYQDASGSLAATDSNSNVVIDRTAPVITLTGNNNVTVTRGNT